MSNLTTRLTIRAGITGLDDIQALAQRLQEAGINTDTLAREARQLQASWGNLSTDEQTAELAELSDEARRLHELARHRITLGLDVDTRVRREIGEVNHAFDELVNSGTLGQDELARASERHRQRINALGRELQSAGNSIHQLFGVRPQNSIENDIREVNTALNRLQRELNEGRISQQEFNRLTQAGEQRLNRLQNELNGTERELNEVGRTTQRTANQLGGLHKGLNLLSGALSALGIGVGISEIIQLSDEFANLQARLKLATGDGIAFKTALSGITDIANKTGSDLTATADLFGKLSRATQELGLSQSELLGVTDSISKAMQVSGGSADSMNAALTQLAQGLSAGALRGDELNSVMEQSPRLARALADGLGVGIGQLKEMGSQGELTAEKVIRAMQSQAAVINAEFAQMPLTVGSSIQVLKNSLLGFVGNLSDELNSNSALADFIQRISDGINSLDPKTVEAVKLTFESLGQIVENVFGQAQTLYDTLSALGSGGSEQVGLLTQALQHLNLMLGLLADAGAGVKIGFDVVFGGMLVAIGNIKEAFGSLVSLVNQDLGEQIKASGQNIITQGKALLDEAHNGAMAFQSKTVKALEAFGQTSADILTKQALDARTAYDQMAQSGKASTDELQNAFADYAQKAIEANGGVVDATLKTELAQHNLQTAVDKTGKTVVQAMDTAQKAADEVSLDELKDEFKDTAGGIKLDFDKASIGISQSFNGAIDTVNHLSERFNDFSKAGIDGTQLLIQALDQLKEKARNKAELDALIAKWQELGAKGQVSTEQLKQGIDGVNAKLDGLKDGVDSVAEAYKLLGLKTKSELQAQADEFKTAYTLIKDSGSATADTLAEAFKKYANAAIIANDGVADSTLKTTAAQHELAITTDNTGKVSVVAQSQLKQSIDDTTNATLRLAKGGQLAGDSLSDGAKKAKDEYDKLGDSIANAQKTPIRAGNPFASKTGIENFLKQAGLDEKEAMKGAVLFEQAGKAYLTPNRENKSLEQRLVEYAESIRYRTPKTNEVSADDVMNSFDKRLAEERQRAKEEAKQEFMQQLISENKRRAN